MEEQVQPNTLTTEQGAEAIKSLMFPDVKPETKQETQPEEGQADVDGEAEEDADGASEEGEDAEEVSDDKSDDSSELFTVKVDGEELQVTLDELVKGFQLEAHYTKKSQKLAETQRVVEEERKALQGVHTKFDQMNDVVLYLNEVHSYLEQSLPPVPSIDLAKTNPAEYIQQKEMRERVQRDMANMAENMQHTKQQAKAILHDMQIAGQKVIQQKMPELLEAQNISNLYSYLTQEYGYARELIDTNADPNLFIMAEKARKYDEMMKKSVNPDYVRQKTHKSKPKPKERNSKITQQKTAMSRFKQSPTTDNAAAAIRELL